MRYESIMFDAFGTIAYIKPGLDNPYKNLSKYTSDRLFVRKSLLTKPINDLEQYFGIKFNARDKEYYCASLLAQVSSISLYDETLQVLSQIKDAGMKISVVSNLAYPFGEPIKKLFGNYVDHFVFSYEVDCAKPDARIYEVALEKLQTTAGQTVMVGDTKKAD
ncbi:MAG: HAD family hydrolase, partial [Methylococcales bacterium]|nr:HAD family hydrolase [Methylococcales bacterium]